MSCMTEGAGGYVESAPKETAPQTASIVLIVAIHPDLLKQWSTRPLFLLCRIGPLLSSFTVAGGCRRTLETGRRTCNTSTAFPLRLLTSQALPCQTPGMYQERKAALLGTP